MIPRLSPTLNNCILHAITPAVKSVIVQFAQGATYSKIITGQYALLKDLFFDYYRLGELAGCPLQKDAFSWNAFSTILQSYNAFDTQIILGPVLRQFMGRTMMQPIFGDFFSDIKEWTEPQDSLAGRYAALSPDQLYRFVANPLWITITYFDNAQNSQSFLAIAPLASVTLYHSGTTLFDGHWELTAEGDPSRYDYANAPNTQLKGIAALFEQGVELCATGFVLLKKHVQLSTLALITKADPSQGFLQIKTSLLEIEKFQVAAMSVSKSLALLLLGSQATPEALRYAKASRVAPCNINPTLQTICRKILDGEKPAVPYDLIELVSMLTKTIVTPGVTQGYSAAYQNEAPTPNHHLKVLAIKVAAERKQVFDQLLNQLIWDSEYIFQRANPDNWNFDRNYIHVARSTQDLIDALSHAGKDFFTDTNKTTKDLAQFKLKCYKALNTNLSVLESHRGLWYHLHPLIRALVGVFAFVFYIPAIVAHKATPSDYYNSFFRVPATASKQRVMQFQQQLAHIEAQLENDLVVEAARLSFN